MGSGDDHVEIDKITDEAKNALSKVFNNLSKTSSSKQILVGSVSGW